MIWYRQVGVVTLAILAVSSLVAWVHVTDRYIAASDLLQRVEFGYKAIHIPNVTSPDQEVTVGVLYYVNNPSGIGLEITQISFQFFMDNITDGRAFVEKASSIFVDRGGFFPQGSPARFAPQALGLIWVNVTIRGDTDPVKVSRLNLTFNGLYYPIVITDFVYRVQGTTIVDRQVGLESRTDTGVAPHEG